MSRFSSARKLERLPWEVGVLPSPLDFAESLIRKGAEDGVASTVAMCRKAKGLDAAMGWAWLVVHDRTESDAWRFDEASRDKGGDWVPAMTALWDAADSFTKQRRPRCKRRLRQFYELVSRSIGRPVVCLMGKSYPNCY